MHHFGTCGVRPVPNLLRKAFASVGLDWVAHPPFLFHADRIDQIAAATAVACTDRSTSRWKQNQRANRKRKRSRETSTPTNKSYDLTSHLYRPPFLTSYIGVRWIRVPLLMDDTPM